MSPYRFDTRPVADPRATVVGDKYRFTVLADGVVRYEYSPDGGFEDRASTFAINRELPVPNFQVLDQDGTLQILTDRLHLTYDKKAFSAGGLMADIRGKMVLNVHGQIHSHSIAWRYGVQDWPALGGTARTLDAVDGRCDLGPSVLSMHGFASIDDSDSMLFDGDGWVASREQGRTDGYLFAFGTDFKAAVQAFYSISGSTPIIPRWALGNWWSRYHPYTADEYVALMDRFQRESIPLSVAVIDMDWHMVSNPQVTHSGWTGYSWERGLIPDPKAFGSQLHSRDLKITLNDHPADGVHAFEDLYEKFAEALGHDISDKVPILFNPTSQKFIKAYLEVLHRSLEDDGCDFWWIDWQQGQYTRIPGIDPLWILNHFHFLDNARDGKSPLIFSRYAGPGSHRYPVGFSGDTIVSWASLHFQPEFTASASNIGYGWWSHDIGGHFHGVRDDELTVRWVQLGVFSPIMRLHSTASTWMSKEPWLFRKEAETVMADFLRLRHRLIPYLYTMNVRAATRNEPLVQPMYWEHPTLGVAYDVPNQYTFGTELLVAAITTPRELKTGLARTKAWLPPGQRFVDIFDGTVYDGDREVIMYRPLHTYPALAHEGSIIPLDGAEVPLNGGRNPSSFKILVVPGKNGSFEIVEQAADDVQSKATGFPDVERRIPITFEQQHGILRAGPTKVDKPDSLGLARAWTFHFVSFSSAAFDNIKVLIDGQEPETDQITFEVQKYPRTPGLVISIPPLPGHSEITIFLGADPQLDVLDHSSHLWEIINGYQIMYDEKDPIWAAATVGDVSPGIRASRLLSRGLDESLVGPVCELVLADSRSSR